VQSTSRAFNRHLSLWCICCEERLHPHSDAEIEKRFELDFLLMPKLSDLNAQTHIIRDWMPVEDPALIGDPSSRTRSGTVMAGTRWVLFVIPAPHPVRDKLQPESRALAFLGHQNRSTWVMVS
jgi:hypothetical protein